MDRMTQPIAVDTDWYQCKACGNFVSCDMRSDIRIMTEIKKNGDCSAYVYSSTTRLRSTFRWCGLRSTTNHLLSKRRQEFGFLKKSSLGLEKQKLENLDQLHRCNPTSLFNFPACANSNAYWPLISRTWKPIRRIWLAHLLHFTSISFKTRSLTFVFRML